MVKLVDILQYRPFLKKTDSENVPNPPKLMILNVDFALKLSN